MQDLVIQNVPPQVSLVEPLQPSTELFASNPLSIPLSTEDLGSPLAVPQPPVTSKKRPISPPSDSEIPTKVRAVSSPALAEDKVSQPQEDHRRTPERLTQPQTPEYSSDSIEATLEEYSKEMIKDFLQTTLSILDSQGIAKVTWPTVPRDCRLRRAVYDLSLLVLTCSHEEMEYQLKHRAIKTANDGGIIIRHSLGIWSVLDNGRHLKSVLSIEVHPSAFLIDHRQNPKRKTTTGRSQDKYSVKCWARYVILNSILSIQTNTLK